VDEELKAFFGDLFQESEDERLARYAGVDEPFSIPDASGYSGNVEPEIQLAETLQSMLGIHSEDAAGIASTIMATRKATVTKSSTRRQQIAQIVDGFRRMAMFGKIANSDGWTRLTESVLAMVEQSVAEVRP
jgi:hypothetical protein